MSVSLFPKDFYQTRDKKGRVIEIMSPFCKMINKRVKNG